MNYEEAITYLYESTPVFQHIGGSAYKPGLERVEALATHFGTPQKHLRTIHVAGTNGKGSTCHTLAAILQSAGYKVGLFTSPHLVDFRERIRINGEKISEAYVSDFVEQAKKEIEEFAPSFFEVTTMMAFSYFLEQGIDVAIIETGMGGRLDSTNIIAPLISVITNISLDHTQFLGDTEQRIAHEKAGIIKPKTPIVIGEATDEIRQIFREEASAVNAPITFAEDVGILTSTSYDKLSQHYLYNTTLWGLVAGELGGEVQPLNARTIFATLSILAAHELFDISASAVRQGFAHVVELTGLMGRWQKISDQPAVFFDTAHNEGGILGIVRRLKEITPANKHLHIVFGMAADKDVAHVLAHLPSTARYYFAKANVDRALSAETLEKEAKSFGLIGKSYPSVAKAYQEALAEAALEDVVFVGGSNFVIADLLSHLNIHP